MRIIDEELLSTFRFPGRCEICGKFCRRREGHHIFARGLASGARLDVRINLLAVGSTRAFACDCHHRIHMGLIPRAELLAIVAKREGRTVESILDELYALRRARKV